MMQVKHSNTRKFLNRIMRIFCVFAAAFFVFLPVWLDSTFGREILFDNVFFHILIGVSALVGADKNIFLSFIYIVIFLPTLVVIVFELILIEAKKCKLGNFNNYIDLHQNKILLAIVLGAFIYSSFALGVVRYFYQQIWGKDHFSCIYTKPHVDVNQSIKKKNLIIIYVESLERGLTDKNIFGENLIKPIDDLKGVCVNKFVSAPGTGWTIAGMVASQCAVPLRVHVFNTSAKSNDFLPRAVCLGDVLASLGYDQYLFVGSSLQFAGRNKFYKGHGCQNLYGLDEFVANGIGSDLLTGWGDTPNDDVVLDEAYNQIVKVSKSSRPFNAVIITTDNHAPFGNPSPRCLQSERNGGFAGAYKCTSRFVANFIEKIRQADVLKNTVVILMGDHLFMALPSQEKYFPKPRYVYFKIIDETSNLKPTRNIMTHFDVAPTILDLLNIEFDTHPRFGLGVSLFAKMSKNEYLKTFDLVTDYSILGPSKVYDDLW